MATEPANAQATRTETFRHERPLAADLAVTSIVAVLHILSFQLTELDGRPLDIFGILLVMVPAALTLARRQRPVLALGIATLLAMTYWVLDYPGSGALWALAVLLYSTALYASERHQSARTLPVFLLIVSAVLVSGYFAPDETDVDITLIITTLAILQFSWFLGDMSRNRRVRIDQLEADMANAEAERIRATDLAVVEERNRIARELHDVVAHAMSVIVVQAEGAKRLVGKNDKAVSDALAAIETTGRTNLNDIRGIVGLLRVDGAPYAPTPELANIDELITHCRDAGLTVSYNVIGEQQPLPVMTELSCYRVIQESLTNVLKHGGPKATATVNVTYGPEAVQLAITDNGRGAAANPAPTQGHGLLGMQERVEAFGGALTSGPRPGGGFRVTADLPITNQPAVTP